MPRKKKATPVSVYLSPKALEIVEIYANNSGYGSVSRTIEEIILAYDKNYYIILGALASSGYKEIFKNPIAVVILLQNLLINFFNLSTGSPLEERIKQDVANSLTEKATSR